MEDQILDTHLAQQPETPAPLTYSTIGARFLALVIDGLILMAVMVGLLFIQNIDKNMYFVTAAIQLGFLLFYDVYLVQSSGATPGKRVMGLKIVKLDGTAAGWNEAFIRYLPTLLITVFGQVLVLMAVINIDADYFQELGWLERLGAVGEGDAFLSSIHQYINIGWVLVDTVPFFVNSNRRALHDMIANTIVISIRE
jgi:uncharacterized RDD family membrane protein YckC